MEYLLKLTRIWRDPRATYGVLQLNGAVVCSTLEPPTLDPPAKPRAIPTGKYRVVLSLSPHFGITVPLLLDVPDFDAVEIHMGNYPHDTHACILVGEQTDFFGGMVELSKSAFERVMAGLNKATTSDSITLVIQ